MDAMYGTGLQYKIAYRFMSGNEVTGYQIVGTDGRTMRASKELVAYFAGKGMVSNAKIQTNTEDGTISLRGVGININDLPVINEKTGEVKNKHGGEVIGKLGVGKVDNSKFEMAARIFAGAQLVGYLLRDKTGKEHTLPRSTVLKYAKEGRVIGVNVTQSNGTDVMRGMSISIDDLPRINISRDNSGAVRIAPKATEEIIESVIAPKTVPVDREVYVEFASVKANIANNNISCIRDKRSNAQGGFKYPIIDLAMEDGADISISTDNGRYKVCNVSKGNSDNGLDGVQFILADYTGKRTMVICKDISYMILHLHSLGMVAYTAANTIGDRSKIREISYENKAKELIWREYFKDAIATTEKDYDEKSDDETINTVEIDNDTLVKLQKDYDIEMSPISDLGRLGRYPTVSMIINGSAVMGIKTARNYYEVDKIVYGYNSGVGLKVVVKSTVGNVSVAVTDGKITKEKVNLKIAISMCAAALAKTEVIQEIIVENEGEGSTVGYLFKLRK